MSKKSTKLEEKNGVYMYLGPTIRGEIFASQMFVGKKSEILAQLAPVIEKHPQISQLIIEDIRLMEAKKLIKTGGNGLAYAYKVLSADN